MLQGSAFVPIDAANPDEWLYTYDFYGISNEKTVLV
jgi:hypothetical protein